MWGRRAEKLALRLSRGWVTGALGAESSERSAPEALAGRAQLEPEPAEPAEPAEPRSAGARQAVATAAVAKPAWSVASEPVSSRWLGSPTTDCRLSVRKAASPWGRA